MHNAQTQQAGRVKLEHAAPQGSQVSLYFVGFSAGASPITTGTSTMTRPPFCRGIAPGK